MKIGATSLTVFLLSLIVYLHTLAPGITWAHNGADSGDLASAAAVGGVPHPSGYPTYLLIGELFRLLPWGDVAYRLNVLSAVAAAISAGLLAWVVGGTLPHGKTDAPGWTDGWMEVTASGSAGLIYAFVPVVWSQAVITEVYSLNALFAVAVLGLAMRAARSGRPATISGAFLLLGLGLGVHLSLVLMSAAVFWLLLPQLRQRPGRFLACALPALLLGLCTYVIIPLRAAHSPPVNWGGASDWAGFWWLVSAEPYRHYVFGLPISCFPDRALAGLRLLFLGTNVWGFAIGILGVGRMWASSWRLSTAVTMVFIGYILYALAHNTTDSDVHLIPAFLAFSTWVGHGLHGLLEMMRPSHDGSGGVRVWRSAALTAVFVSLSLAGITWQWSGQDLSADTQALDYATEVLETLEQDSLVVARSDAHTFALWYARYGLGLRRDIAVVNDSLWRYPWYRATVREHHPAIFIHLSGAIPPDPFLLIEANLPHRAVYVTDRPDPLPPGYALQKIGDYWRLVHR